MTDTPVTRPAEQVTRDTAYGYASAYGYAAQTLDFILQACDDRKPQVDEFYGLDEIANLERIRDMAARGISESNAALRRYGARIETLDTPN